MHRRFGAIKIYLPFNPRSIFHPGRIFTIAECLMRAVQIPDLDIREWIDALHNQILVY